MRGLAIGVVVCAGLVGSRPAIAQKPWFEIYERAVELQLNDRFVESVDLLKQCLVLKPRPEARARTEGVRYVDYLPHLYLGVAFAETGKKELALEYFDLAERDGTVKRSEEGLAILEKYRLRLANARVFEPASPPAAPVLSEDEYRRIEGQIIDRCHIRRGTARELYPWYFHYELGLELLKHQDPSRALGSLLEALDRRETPERYVRTYGMWYLNYAPYYNIGRAHYLMGSYDCAADAFKMSETLQELDPAQPDFAERRSLLQQSSNKAGPR